MSDQETLTDFTIRAWEDDDIDLKAKLTIALESTFEEFSLKYDKIPLNQRLAMFDMFTKGFLEGVQRGIIISKDKIVK